MDRNARRRRDFAVYEPYNAREEGQDDNGLLSENARSGDFGSDRRRQHIFKDATTIRAVTPDSIPEEDVPGTGTPPETTEQSRIASSPPASPRTRQHPSPRHPPKGILRSNSREQDFTPRTMKDVQAARPRTRTMEERTRDRSPSSLFMKARHRIGSVHSAAAANYQGLEETITSIGHPQIVPAPNNPSSEQATPMAKSGSSRQRALKQPPRSASPLASSLPRQEEIIPPLPTSTRNEMIHLMRMTCGRMQGSLAFRRGDRAPWSLAYCLIDDEFGKLVYEPKSDTTFHKTLIPDLRGCHIKPAHDKESQMPFLEVSVPNSSLEVHLRPHTKQEYDQWYAALLCWKPYQPKGIQNKMAKPQTTIVADRRLADSRRHSEVSLLREAPIIKVGKMIFWDTNVAYSNVGTPKSSRPVAYRMASYGSRRWRKISCTLRENGELKLYSENDVTLVSVVQLSQLSRCAVQRLDPSVLDNEFCIAIYPQYNTTGNGSASFHQPIFVSLESRVLYEVWFVLLRAFTIPQLYGPKQPAIEDDIGATQFAASTLDMFRMERGLSVRVIEAKLSNPVSPIVSDHHPHSTTIPNSNSNSKTSLNSKDSKASMSTPKPLSAAYYVEVQLDGETHARTIAKTEPYNPFWREDFEFSDLPAALATATLVVKKRPPDHVLLGDKKEDPRKAGDNPYSASDAKGHYTGIFFDELVGKVDVYLDDFESGKEVEKWWPMMNVYGHSVGEILCKVRVEEGVILMSRDYQSLSELLHRFSNGLTLQLAQMMPSELKRLSDYLLNIFQVSGAANEWLMALVEEEIDGTHKETPVSRLRFSRRMGSNDSNESFGSASDRELFVREVGKSALLEANLLFRGNTLLTKSLDSHMKRLGKEYLEETLAEKLHEINEKDPECEVDPNRCDSEQHIQRNWTRLTQLTKEVWQCIYNTASKCPAELRMVFKHIRACAEDRYGDFLRSVSYSSVSGFLFLRFFCPAVLNPKLFGLLKDHPKQRTQRTLTLIAKSLQGLANMTTFGAKEHWMEPMNHFVTGHRQEFKDFIDQICSIPADQARNTAALPPPSYSTPIAILNRLPSTSREGFPSLPYLIDHARSFAQLVSLWLETTQKTASQIQQTDGELLKFHQMCVALQRRTEDCLNRAERAERPSSRQSFKWEELVEQLEKAAIGTSASSTAASSAASSFNNGSQQQTPRPGLARNLSVSGGLHHSSSTNTAVTSLGRLRTSPSNNSVPSAKSASTSNPATTGSSTTSSTRVSFDEDAIDDDEDEDDVTPPGSATGYDEGYGGRSLEDSIRLPPLDRDLREEREKERNAILARGLQEARAEEEAERAREGIEHGTTALPRVASKGKVALTKKDKEKHVRVVEHNGHGHSHTHGSEEHSPGSGTFPLDFKLPFVHGKKKYKDEEEEKRERKKEKEKSREKERERAMERARREKERDKAKEKHKREERDKGKDKDKDKDKERRKEDEREKNRSRDGTEIKFI